MLYFEEGSAEWKHADSVLQSLKRFADNLEEHEKQFLEAGLIDHKDRHDSAGPDFESQSKHQKEKFAWLDQEGKLRSDEEWRRS